MPVLAAAGLAFCLLSACTPRPTGDFGRAAPDVVHDQVMPAIGEVRTVVTGQPYSSFNKTDEETEMADRIWRFLASGRVHDWSYDTATELHRTRILPGGNDSIRVDRYYIWLHKTPYQSAEVRYATVSDDIAADLATVPDTFASICTVEKIDEQRTEALQSLPGLGPYDGSNVAARQAENQDQIDWFTNALRYRYDNYNYALNQLVVEQPNQQAVGVDSDLTALSADVARAESGQFCPQSRQTAGRRGPPDIPSRFSRPAPSGAGPVKGS